MKKSIQLKSKEIKDLKIKWVKELDFICPLLNEKFDVDSFVLDHYHQLKKLEPDLVSGKGYCRNVLHNSANQFEGKVMSIYKRFGLEQYIDLPTLLRRLANYLECNRFHTDEIVYIHPSEAPLKPILTKRCYNKLVKVVDGKQKIPEYKEKRGNFTKSLEKLYIKYGIDPEFKKQ